MKNEIIVITGSIATGKSSIINTIKAESENKVDFFSFDDFIKDLYLQEDVKSFLTVMFGTADKSKISDIVFSSPVMLDSLNNYFLVKVEEKFLEMLNRKSNVPLVIEFPMFFEVKERSTAVKMVRSKVKVIAVICDEAVILNRAQARDNFAADKIKSILSAQFSQEFKAEKADYVIDTSSGNGEQLTKELMHSKFRKVFFHVDSK